MTKKVTELAENSLNIGDSIIMGIAGSAPAFSLAVATATLMASINTLAPASILYCGLLMFGITLAFIHLNKVIVNAGASYAWVSQIFNPFLGFFTGWTLLVSSTVFMVSGSIPAATATLLLVAPDLVSNPHWVMLIATAWLTLITLITLKGIKTSSRVQIFMTGLEVLILVAIILGGIFFFYKHPAHVFSIAWLSLFNFSPSLFATGALTALFLYWGWDVTLNLSEETKNKQYTPGWGAFWAVIIIILLFVCFSITVLLVLTDTEIQASGTNIIFETANKVFPKPWSYLAVLCVILSTIGTLETTLLQFTRTLFAKSRDGVLHHRYAVLHASWNTPWVAILFIWSLGVLFLVLSSFFSTIDIIIKDSVHAIGFQASLYYSITGFACARYYQKLWKTISELFIYIIWPTLSALFFILIALLSIPSFDFVTLMISFGGIFLGIIPLYLNHRAKRRLVPPQH